MSLQKLHLEVELTGQRGRVATRIGQNVLDAGKTYVVNISKTKRDRAVVTTKRE